jgi:hypothetical protein
MPYRPQFAYSTPPGCKDVSFVYTFDASNTPWLAQDINGDTIDYMGLPLEQDAPFFWRGIKLGPLRVIIGGVTNSYALPNYGVYFRDCYDNDIADSRVGAVRGWFPMNPLAIGSSLLTGPPCPLESEIYCPPGGVIQAFLKVPVLTSGGGQTYSTSFSFYGVKRYRECAA